VCESRFFGSEEVRFSYVSCSRERGGEKDRKMPRRERLLQRILALSENTNVLRASARNLEKISVIVRKKEKNRSWPSGSHITAIAERAV